MAIATVNPATGETLKTFDELGDDELETKIAAAAAAARSYRRTSFAERARWLGRAADLLDAEVDRTAVLLTTEMGKTVTAARQEIHKCAAACRFFAEHGRAYLDDAAADAGAVGATQAFTRWEPMGVVLAVMPWNFPLWQAMRFAAPALMAGNVGLLKHASNVPQTALLLEDVFDRAGFPAGTFQTLLIGSERVERVLRDDRVAAVTLTGSGPAGAAVAAVAGEVVKPSVLELGGSDPFLVLPSADLDRAAEVAADARCLNNGQSCIAAKRFIVHSAVYDEFCARFVDAMAGKVIGDPLDERTEIGPLASEAQLHDVAALVADALEHGAVARCGGEAIEGPGSWFPPTVLTEVTPSMRVHTEEVFGPVATLYRVDSLDEAIALANATDFGLGANAWTRDDAEAERLVDELDAGMVFLNGNVTSYPELPFGGTKASGYGRELAANGIRAFCNLKTVWVGEGVDPLARRVS